MVQEFQVLRCFCCHVFQVHQVKKSKKWACKLCGEKQSLLKVYGQGSGADCRRHVQKLNLLQGQVERAERAATGTDGESCENDTCIDDIGDETKQGLTTPEEAAPMSRWNKYLGENTDCTCEEEEEGRVSTDQEHYYSHQDCTSRTVSKRKHLLYNRSDLDTEDLKENISKKNKIYEGGNPLKDHRISYNATEDLGCLKQHDKPVSHTLPLQNSSDTFLPTNKLEGHFKQSACSTAGFLKREPKMDTIYNHFDHTKKIGADCCVRSSQDTLPNDEPTTTNRLCAQKVSSPGLHISAVGSAAHQSDITLKTSSSLSLQKHVIQSHLFQTDEDFDDNY